MELDKVTISARSARRSRRGRAQFGVSLSATGPDTLIFGPLSCAQQRGNGIGIGVTADEAQQANVVDIMQVAFDYARRAMATTTMVMLPITYHTNVAPPLRTAIERIVGGHHTLEQVFDWCQAQHPPQWIEAIVAQDEFTSDVIVRFNQQLYCVYDTT
jgi:hypothetical protein